MHTIQRSALIYLAISAAIEHEHTTAINLAKRAGLSGPAITGLSRGDRPTPSTVGAICRAVASISDAGEILCSHLLDEVVRADLAPSSVTIRPTGRAVVGCDYQRRVDRIAASAARNPALAKLLDCLETMATQMPYDSAIDQLAAEPPRPEYRAGPSDATPPRKPRKPRA